MELKQRQMGNLEDFNQLMVGPIESSLSHKGVTTICGNIY